LLICLKPVYLQVSLLEYIIKELNNNIFARYCSFITIL